MRLSITLVVATLSLFGPESRSPNTQSTSARTGATDARELTSVQIQNLATLGKVWGFTKYHHPVVTSGGKEWDVELVRTIGSVLEAKDVAAGNAIIDAWLESVGKPTCSPCAERPTGDIHLRPNLDWLRNQSQLGKSLSDRLVAIHDYRSVAPRQKYLGATSIGNPEFLEDDYREHTSPGPELRLLALFRFWSIIEYWFPYRDLIEEDWHAVLNEFIPKFWEAHERDAYTLQMIAIVARVHDTHANVWNGLAVRPPVGVHRLPVTVRFVNDSAVVSGYANAELGRRSGLQPGDVILGMNGAPVDSLVKAWTPYYAASNHPTRLRDIGNQLTNGPAGPVNLSIVRNGARMNLTAMRVSRDSVNLRAGVTHDLPGATFQKLTPDVAYIKLSSISLDSVSSYMTQASGAKVLVIDIRNYPSAFVVFAIGQHLVKSPTPFARFTMGDPQNPGLFRFRVGASLQPKEPHFGGKVVILVDEVSQSQSEYTTMAFRASPNAMVVGSTTAGADGNVSTIPLPGGLRAMISGIGVFYPDKSPTQRTGIIPNLVVKPTIQGIRDGRDEVLEAGVSKALGTDFKLPPKG